MDVKNGFRYLARPFDRYQMNTTTKYQRKMRRVQHSFNSDGEYVWYKWDDQVNQWREIHNLDNYIAQANVPQVIIQ